MRVAILADIHGNLPACEAVLDDIKKQAPDYIVAAGDLALRGANPAEVVDLLFDACDGLLIGNTDSYVAGNYLSGAYRDKDHWKTSLLEWTRAELGQARVEKLAQMPFSLRYSPRRGQDLYVCHANPRNLEDSLEPTLDEATLRRYLSHLDASAVAFGHLHFPYRRRIGRMVIADVASAGIPRDGDLRPAWGLFTFTPKGWRVQIRRVRYQLRKATQLMTERKVPGAPLLIHKMIEGRYRHHEQLSEAARRHSGLPPLPLLRPPPGAKPRTGSSPAFHPRFPTAQPVDAPSDIEASPTLRTAAAMAETSIPVTEQNPAHVPSGDTDSHFAHELPNDTEVHLAHVPEGEALGDNPPQGSDSHDAIDPSADEPLAK